LARIKINIPNTPALYEGCLDVRVGDLNYGDHVGNDRYLLYAHEIRMRYLTKIKQTEKNFFGESIIMNDSACQYRGEAFFGDQLNYQLWAEDYQSFGLDLIYRIYHIERGDIAYIKTGIVFYDYKKKKLTPAPENLEERINSAHIL
jgi:acyl-CoA thioester hydrolase